MKLISKILQKITGTDSLERRHYLGRQITVLLDGAWEIKGIVTDIDSDVLMVKQNGKIIEVKRDKIVAEHLDRGDFSDDPVKRLVHHSPQGYDNPEGMVRPAVARATTKQASTPLEEKLKNATEEASKLREEFSVLEDEIPDLEKKYYGSIIPEDMLLPDENSKSEQVDLSMSFDSVSFENEDD